MTWLERAQRRFEETGEQRIRKRYDDMPVVVDHVVGPMRLRKSSQEVQVNGIGKPKKKRSRAKKYARRKLGKATWKTLPPDVKKILISDAKKVLALAKLQKLVDRDTVTNTAPAIVSVDPTLSKIVCRSQPDSASAEVASNAIRDALRKGQAGAGGWR